MYCSGLELSGAITWQGKVADTAQTRFLNNDKIHAAAFQGTIPFTNDTNLVNVLYKFYVTGLQSGYQLPKLDSTGYELTSDGQSFAQYISSGSGNDYAITSAFLKSMAYLSSIGQITGQDYNPVTFVAAKQSTATATGSLDLKNIGQSIETNMNKILIVAGLGIGAYLFAQISGFIPRKRV